jgi:hypothetical protein
MDKGADHADLAEFAVAQKLIGADVMRADAPMRPI